MKTTNLEIKTLKVDCCWNCPLQNEDKYGYTVCYFTNLELKDETEMPEWCPLPITIMKEKNNE